MKRPELHIAVCNKIALKADMDGLIEWNKLLTYLGRDLHIPKEVRIKVINELENLGLIKKLDKFKVQVLIN